jgi:hypothetical protein
MCERWRFLEEIYVSISFVAFRYSGSFYFLLSFISFYFAILLYLLYVLLFTCTTF